VAVLRAPLPDAPARFIHRDYHPTNVLWAGGRLSGVVDWPNACLGPAAVDVAHCRANLAQLYGTAVADHFLHTYEQAAGGMFVYDPYWDVRAIADMVLLDVAEPPRVYSGWPAHGVTGLTDALILARLEAHLAGALARL
jgi:hypothetical protein